MYIITESRIVHKETQRERLIILHFINPSKTFNVGKVKGRTDIIKNLTIEVQYVQKYIKIH